MAIWKRVVLLLAVVLIAGGAVYGLDALAQHRAWPRGYVTAVVSSALGLVSLAAGLLTREPPGPFGRRELIRGGAVLVLVAVSLAGLEYFGSASQRQTAEEIKRLNEEIERREGRR